MLNNEQVKQNRYILNIIINCISFISVFKLALWTMSNLIHQILASFEINQFQCRTRFLTKGSSCKMYLKAPQKTDNKILQIILKLYQLHCCGRGVTSLPLIQRARVQIPAGSVSWLRFFLEFFLNCKTNVRKFRQLSLDTIWLS